MLKRIKRVRKVNVNYPFDDRKKTTRSMVKKVIGREKDSKEIVEDNEERRCFLCG